MRRRAFGALFAAVILTALLAMSCASAPPGPAVEPLDPSVVVEWVPEVAEQFAKEVPKAVQKIAKKETEKQARLRGKALIDQALYDELKAEMGR